MSTVQIDSNHFMTEIAVNGQKITGVQRFELSQSVGTVPTLILTLLPIDSITVETDDSCDVYKVEE